MPSAFDRFPRRLQEAIVARLGWASLRPVQDMAGDAILDGKNAVVLAPTAGGKTEASIFPILAQIIEDEPDGLGAIYIAPLKALLNNQEERLGLYTSMVGLGRFVWHGDVKASAKQKFIQEPATILMTTPESLEVTLLSPRIPHRKLFQDLRVVIIDEVHALAGQDRGAHLMSVLERITALSKHDIQRIGLSATVGNPEDILSWMQGTSKRSGAVINPSHPPTRKDIRVHLIDNYLDVALHAASRAAGNKSLFFCQSRALAEKIAECSRTYGTEVYVHHSSVSQEERARAEAQFHGNTNACIVCTSTLELGIDIGDLDLVFQANAPGSVSSFLQRLGRTGRREGQTANTAFYCEEIESALQAVAIVELARRRWIEAVPVQTRVWPVLVHQLFALTLQFGAIKPDQCWMQLRRVPDFSGINRQEFDQLISHMLLEGYLFEAEGRISIGEKAERIYGRKNFMELYAVFSTPELFQVKTKAGYVLGTLEYHFVDTLIEEEASFLLGGRAWLVESLNYEDRIVTVIPAPRGKKPSWGGIIPQILGYEICQEVKAILNENRRIGYADTAIQRSIQSLHDDLLPVFHGNEWVIDHGAHRARWWTFAGGRINYTLKYGLHILTGWTASVDNFSLKIEGPITTKRLQECIDQLRDPAFWERSDVIQYLRDRLPNYRLSKFQQVLPKDFAREVIASYLLDVPGVIRHLEG